MTQSKWEKMVNQKSAKITTEKGDVLICFYDRVPFACSYCEWKDNCITGKEIRHAIVEHKRKELYASIAKMQ